MLQLTIITWMLIIFEAITFLPLLGAQLVILLKPHGQKAKDILIGIGKKIWNLDNAIWTLQGRQRDMVHFADFIYNKPGTQVDVPIAYLPGRENGKWDYYGYTNRSIDKKNFEQFLKYLAKKTKILLVIL